MDIQTLKQRFGIIGNSPSLHYALSVAERVASTNLTVLITGESGVGKEVFSQIIHQLSSRKHNPFIAVNCGAIPEGTIDSELFGHEKGSFTGASDKRKGYFETVDSGTIFLDEIGEMPLGTQARLLRVLESGEFIKVGSSNVQKTDVRVIAATNVNLLDSVQKGKFREDLYYRLSTVPIEIPALRDRGEDIVLLFRKFCADFAEKNKTSPVRLDNEANDLLLRYNWPGNVRQLKNIADQVSVLSTNKMVTASELSHFIPEIHPPKTPMLFENKESSSGMGFNERELLYKMLFDIKKDINDLKQFMLTVGQQTVNTSSFIANPGIVSAPSHIENDSYNKMESSTPIILSDKVGGFSTVETIDESLSLESKEKELIVRALKNIEEREKMQQKI